jgi:protein-disulfide isomerase
LLRNLLTAIAAVAIIGVAGAVYFLHRDVPSSGTNVPTPAPSAGTATNTSPGESAQPPSPSASTPSTTGPEATTSSPGTTASTPPTTPGAAPQTAVVPPPPSDIGADEHILGKADAPLTIIEYASMTCPHCAKFDTETMPRIKSEFIDKGLVRFVFRPFPLDGLAARASLLAQCAPPDGYFSMIDVLFRSQNDWARASDPLAALKQIGRTAGLSNADIDRCVADEAGLNRLVDGIKEAQAKFGVDSTPSFVINGKKYTNMPFDDYQEEGATKPGFGTVIKSLLPKS